MTDRQAMRVVGLVVFLVSPIAAVGWGRYSASSSPRTGGTWIGIAAAGAGLVLSQTLPDGALCIFAAFALWAFTGLTLLAIRRWSRGQELWPGESNTARRPLR